MHTGCSRRAAAVLPTVAAGSGLLLGAGRASGATAWFILAALRFNPLSTTTPVSAQ